MKGTGVLDSEIKMTHAARQALIGKTLTIKGIITGSEPLRIAGKVEGSMEFSGQDVIIEPEGVVVSDISAGTVVVRGTVRGNVNATDRVELCDAGSFTGDINTRRIRIEEDAQVKGKVEINNIEAG